MPARKISTLIDDPGLRNQMGAIGLERIRKRLAWHHQEKHLLEVYAQLGFETTQEVSAEDSRKSELVGQATANVG